MTKFLDDFYRFEDGSLYRLNVNDARNTFGGITYPSRITFFVNTAPTEDKESDDEQSQKTSGKNVKADSGMKNPVIWISGIGIIIIIILLIYFLKKKK